MPTGHKAITVYTLYDYILLRYYYYDNGQRPHLQLARSYMSYQAKIKNIWFKML